MFICTILFFQLVNRSADILTSVDVWSGIYFSIFIIYSIFTLNETFYILNETFYNLNETLIYNLNKYGTVIVDQNIIIIVYSNLTFYNLKVNI